MDIIEVHNIRPEIFQQTNELPFHLLRAERSRESHQPAHVLREILLPRRLQILGIIHGEHRHLMSLLLQQLLRIEHAHAVPAPAVVEFVGK